ncbi:MAG: alpha/beta hydrolase [Porticoccaceae bacterium]|nr:alpha/beta hydrolase [Porticoccaceae bacterium]
MNNIFIAAILVATVIILRQLGLHRLQTKKNSEPFDGILYAIGESVIAVRASAVPPKATVIAMHGFMEDQRYFTGLYTDSEIELILITSADYHVPVNDAQIQRPSWEKSIVYEPATIEYDAAVINQALEHLPSTEIIRLHGHSRGGAVILEAAIQRPELHQNVEFILEAPVLPQIGFHPNTERNFSPLGIWLLPFTLPLLARLPLTAYGEHLYGDLGSERKREILAGLASTPKHYSTLVKNSKAIRSWARTRQYDVYQLIPRGTLLVGEDERVLDRDSMLKSAGYAKSSLDIVEVAGTTHFVTLDKPNCLPPLITP